MLGDKSIIAHVHECEKRSKFQYYVGEMESADKRRSLSKGQGFFRVNMRPASVGNAMVDGVATGLEGERTEIGHMTSAYYRSDWR